MYMNRRAFLRTAGISVLGAAGLALTACGSPGSNAKTSSGSTSSSPSSSGNAQSGSGAGSKPLVIYFSRTDENYGVGYIEEGNTAIIAKMIAEKTGADTFEIVPAEKYPEGYDACCDVALEEKNSSARPAIAGDIDISAYSTIYLGYPIWWGELPMCVYTFIEAHDWSGKEIHPFCTHAGSGLSGTDSSIRNACKGATVQKGFAIAGTTAQNSRDQAKSEVEAWIG